MKQTWTDYTAGLRPRSRAGQMRIYLSGARWEAIFTTCVWSSVSHASTPLASASERPSPTAVSCVGDVACGALGMTLISCSRTAVERETRMSPGFRSDNDWSFESFGTNSVWAGSDNSRCSVQDITGWLFGWKIAAMCIDALRHQA